MKLYQRIASKMAARINCTASGNTVWFARHTVDIEDLVRDHMPSGSGVDCGTQLDFDNSQPNRMVFVLSFHHMDENGGYDGWTSHQVIVTPSLAYGIDVRVTGRDRNWIKDYLTGLYQDALTTEVL